MRIRYAVIAILVALAAVTAGAQASDTTNTGQSGPGRLASAKGADGSNRIRLGGHKQAGTMKPKTLRTHTPDTVGTDDYFSAPDLSGDINSNPDCRYSSECFLIDEDNIGATLDSFEQPPNNTCQFSSNTITYKDTVWYKFQVSRSGILDLDVDGSYTAGFVPLLLLGEYSSGPDSCFLADAGSQTFSLQGVTVTAGTVVVVGVAAQSSGNDGEYDLGFSWDPDTDGDGSVDSFDRCDSQRGPSNLRGCPDSDGDGIPNIDDNCDTLRGPRSLGGCPDSDGDGLLDPRDACDHESTRGKIDKNANGCPDYHALPDLRVDGNGYIKGNLVAGIKFSVLKFKGKLPRGTKVKIKCKPKRSCKIRRKGSLKKRLGRVRFSKKSRLRKQKIKITISETKKGYVSKVFSFYVGFKRNSAGGRNTFVRSPKKRCIPATGGKSRKCSSKMLLR